MTQIAQPAPLVPGGPAAAPGTVSGDPGAAASGTDTTPGAGPTVAQPAPPRKERDPYFDNAKFLAILLVVIGHSIAGLRDVQLAKAGYLFIYMFHMPLFIVVTGYFSRNFTFAGGKARKLITNLGVPYVVFEFAYSTYDWLVGKGDLDITLLDPYYLTWFLMALFLWRLSTPVWQQIRWPLGVAMAISLLSYMSALSNQLDMHRVLGLAPFYVFGLLLRPEHFELLKRPQARVIGFATLLGGMAFALFACRRMSSDWVLWKYSHAHMGVGNVTGTVMRLAMFVAATILVLAFLAIVPRRRTWYTALGATTLYAYLLHGFVTRLMQYLDWDKFDYWHTIPGVLTMAACAVVVGTLLCTKPVVRCMSWALEPKMPWAFTELRRPRPRRR